MIGIIDYGVGNLFSLSCSLQALGEEVVISGNADTLSKADRLLLPGVGAFEDAANKLRQSGLDRFVIAEAKGGKPLLGICLGMQLLFEKSHEYGTFDGLGLIRGEVVPMAGTIPSELKIPHIGWNSLHITRPSPLFAEVSEGDFVYFVHSFYASGCEEAVIATAEYGKPLTAAVQKDNIFGCQFHPEKSGRVGLAILRAFCRWQKA